MTESESLELDAHVRDLGKLRVNGWWRHRLVPEIERLRDEARQGMRDRTKTPAERCEHQSTWEALQSVLDFQEKEEARLKGLLREFDQTSAFGAFQRPG